MPLHIKPEPVMCEVEQPPFDATMLRQTKVRAPKRVKPQARRGQPIPKGETGRFCWAAELSRRNDEREYTYSDTESDTAGDDRPTHSPGVSRPSSRSSLLRSSSLKNAANLTDDSDDADITHSHAAIPLPCSLSRFEPHPLISVLENSPVPEEPLFLLSPTRTPDPSPSLHVPDNPTSPIRKRKRSQHTNAFICAEAERETDSEEHGDSDENYDGPSSADENDEDRAAVGDFQPTQQAGYEQQAVYLLSLIHI